LTGGVMELHPDPKAKVATPVAAVAAAPKAGGSADAAFNELKEV
jgi:hypothetical protein